MGKDMVAVNSVLQGMFRSRTKKCSGQEPDAHVPSACDHRRGRKATM